MNPSLLTAALQRPARELGILPELAALRPQFAVHIYDCLSSTNRHAWEWVDQGAEAGTVIIARQQQAGKGQWGRHWVSPPGGLYLSLVLEPDLAIAEGIILTLASAWGITTALNNLGIPAQLKWPNDLVSQGQKLGGILTETRSAPASETDDGDTSLRLCTAVVGVGLNWQNPLPVGGLSLTALLPESSDQPLQTLEDLAAVVLRGILQGYQYWQQQGTPKFVQVYQQKLTSLGQTVTVDGQVGKVTGVSLAGDLRVHFYGTGRPHTRVFKSGEIRLGYNSSN